MVAFVLIERGDGGVTHVLWDGAFPPAETEKLVEGLKEGRIAGLDHLGWNAIIAGAFWFENASMAFSSSLMVGSASRGFIELRAASVTTVSRR